MLSTSAPICLTLAICFSVSQTMSTKLPSFALPKPVAPSLLQRILDRSVGWLVLGGVLGGVLLTSDRNMAWVLEQFASAGELNAKAAESENLAARTDEEADALIADIAEKLRSGKISADDAAEELNRAGGWKEGVALGRQRAAKLREKARRHTTPGSKP